MPAKRTARTKAARASPIERPASKPAKTAPVSRTARHSTPTDCNSLVVDTAIVDGAISAFDLFGDDSGDDASPLCDAVSAAIGTPSLDASASIAMDASVDKDKSAPSIEQQSSTVDDIDVVSKKQLINNLDRIDAFSLYGADVLIAQQQLAAAYLRERGYHNKAWAGIEMHSTKTPGRDFSFYNHASDRACVLTGLSINDGGPVMFDDGRFSDKNYCHISQLPYDGNKVTFTRYHANLPHPLGGEGLTLAWGEPVEPLVKPTDEASADTRMVKAIAKTGKGGHIATFVSVKEAKALGLEIPGEAC